MISPPPLASERASDFLHMRISRATSFKTGIANIDTKIQIRRDIIGRRTQRKRQNEGKVPSSSRTRPSTSTFRLDSQLFHDIVRILALVRRAESEYRYGIKIKENLPGRSRLIRLNMRPATVLNPPSSACRRGSHFLHKRISGSASF